MLIDNAYFNFPDFYRCIAAKSTFCTFVEVGVYTGASVTFLAQELKKHGRPFKLYAVDLWELAAETGYKDLWMDLEVWDAFQQRLRLTETVFDIEVMKTSSEQAATGFRDGSVDFVFIDADHSYEAAKADIQTWLPKIKAGGIIAGHDILEASCGVAQAVTDIFGKDGFIVLNNCWVVNVDVPRGTIGKSIQ